MFKFLALIGLLILLFAVFGWSVLLPGIIVGVVIAIWRARKGSSTSRPADVIQWYVPADSRGNRFMADDPLDAPFGVTELERQELMKELLPNRRHDSQTLALRHRLLTEPQLLASADGIDILNGVGVNAYKVLSPRVSNWQTNDFRKFAVELITA